MDSRAFVGGLNSRRPNHCECSSSGRPTQNPPRPLDRNSRRVLLELSPKNGTIRTTIRSVHRLWSVSEKEGLGHTKALGKSKEAAPVSSSGQIIKSGDSKIDGSVKDAHELMHRLARSARVRQSFVRHAFRFWMGRNEKLTDSPTLIAADKAYVDNGGSFKSLVIELLTSDSFVYRK